MFFVAILAYFFVALVPDFTDSPSGPCIVDGPRDHFDIDEMLRQVNRVRASAHAGPLRLNHQLMRAAQCHSAYQARKRRMSHVGLKRSGVGGRVRREGYPFRNVAENVAYNQRSVTRVMTAWIHSPGHYQNLINPKFKEFGAGMVNFYWTQNFGSQSE